MTAISIAIECAGGPVLASKTCGISRQAVDKWLSKGSLPRTEYTGETNYAERLAAAARERGAPVEAAWLLAECAPKKTAA